MDLDVVVAAGSEGVGSVAPETAIAAKSQMFTGMAADPTTALASLGERGLDEKSARCPWRASMASSAVSI
ncbi:hypothetical protein SAMN05519103_09189 [Rhizobiales bacterium GAS113]|nr:hypothetical protein SAMN05519103_09189 [Rhizobiales bacterium GAS113]